jgi:Domain of unknown function (DUF4382)
MHSMPGIRALLALLVIPGWALTACSARTDVSVNGNAPAKYSHVWVTAQEVWFNSSGSAGPDDGGWVKFSLSTPATVDLVTVTGGNLGSLVTGLRLTPGTYSQLRLIPVDAAAALTSSAQTAGARYNSEADYVDASGTTHQLPLELLNPDQGIGISGSFKVPIGDLGTALTAVSSTGSSSSGNGLTVSATTGSASSGSGTRTAFAINLDGGHDLTPFTYGTTGTANNGILLSSHARAYDLSTVGAIEGQLTLTNLTGISGSSGLPAIRVSAESLSADGTRHVVVNSTAVQADGSFLLYPLATSASSPAEYDVVIHGPGIATLIIKAVQVTLATGASGATPTNTASNNSAINPVSVGTLIPRAATFYTTNLHNTAPLPAGARIGFYQTLSGSGEKPYLIEASPIDPFNQVFADDQALSAGTVDSGTFAAGGTSITLVSAAPAEGAGTYLVAASAPSYEDGALTAKVSKPSAGVTTAVTLPELSLTLASGTTSGAIAASVTQTTAGRYDRGELLVSHDGTLIATAALDAALRSPAGATLSLSGVPAGTPAALYYVTVRAWNSSDPTGSLHRQFYPAALDLRGGASGAIQLTID